MRKRRPLGEWWKNHILPHFGEEHANVTILEARLNLNEAIRHQMRKLWAMLEPHYIALKNPKKLNNITSLWLLAKWECWRWSSRLVVVNKNVMKEAWDIIKLEYGHNIAPRGIIIIPYCLYDPRKRRKTIKCKARRVWDHLPPSNKEQGKGWGWPSHSKHCSYAFVYVFLLVHSHL